MSSAIDLVIKRSIKGTNEKIVDGVDEKLCFSGYPLSYLEIFDALGVFHKKNKTFRRWIYVISAYATILVKRNPPPSHLRSSVYACLSEVLDG